MKVSLAADTCIKYGRQPLKNQLPLLPFLLLEKKDWKGEMVYYYYLSFFFNQKAELFLDEVYRRYFNDSNCLLNPVSQLYSWKIELLLSYCNVDWLLLKFYHTI